MNWSKFLRRWRLDGLISVLLEGAGPFTLVFAQLAYFTQPFVKNSFPAGEWEELVLLLEDQEACRRFASFLRDGV